MNGRVKGFKPSTKLAAVSPEDAEVRDAVEGKATAVHDTHGLNEAKENKKCRQSVRRLAERALALEAGRGRAKLATYKRRQGSFGFNTADADENNPPQDKRRQNGKLVQVAERERARKADLQ